MASSVCHSCLFRPTSVLEFKKHQNNLWGWKGGRVKGCSLLCHFWRIAMNTALNSSYVLSKSESVLYPPFVFLFQMPTPDHHKKDLVGRVKHSHFKKYSSFKRHCFRWVWLVTARTFACVLCISPTLCWHAGRSYFKRASNRLMWRNITWSNQLCYSSNNTN